MRGRRKCQDTEWVVVMLERAGRGGSHCLCKSQGSSDLIRVGKKALVLKHAQRSLWESPGHTGSTCYSQTVYFLFPMSPTKLAHFPLLYRWQTEGSQVFSSTACLLSQSGFCASLRSAVSSNSYPFVSRVFKRMSSHLPLF